MLSKSTLAAARRPALIALVAGLTFAAPAFAAGVAGDAHTGRALFLSHCAVCHKANAAGGIKLGDTTSADLQAPGLESQYHENDALIKRAILDGEDEEGGQLDKIMPRWAKKGLTDAQANDIIAYLHTVKTSD